MGSPSAKKVLITSKATRFHRASPSLWPNAAAVWC
ncbi:hypothetical protein FF2_044138 [Malus domestica]